MNINIENYEIQKFVNEDSNIILVYNPDTGEIDFESKLNTSLEDTLNSLIDFFQSIKDSIVPKAIIEPEVVDEPVEENVINNTQMSTEQLAQMMMQMMSNMNQTGQQPKAIPEPVNSNGEFQINAVHKQHNKVDRPSILSVKKTKVN